MNRIPTQALLSAALVAGAAVAQETVPTTQPESKPSTIPIPSDLEAPTIGISLTDALHVGRMNNVRLKARELLPLQAAEDLRGARAELEPEFITEAGARHVNEPSRNVFAPSIEREIYDASIGWRQKVVSGGTFDLRWEPSLLRQTTTTAGFPEKQYTSAFSATYTQPLLRGAWSDYTLRNSAIAAASRAGSAHQLARDVQDTMLEISRAYWELVFARENYRVLTASLELAREQLRITLERIRVRELAERDRVADEADVARRIGDQIVAEHLIRQQEDQLRKLLFHDADGELWRRAMVPTSPIEPNRKMIPEDWRVHVRIALRERSDLQVLRSQVSVAEVQLMAAERDVLPRLDLVSSYEGNGVTAHFDDAFENSYQNDFPGWSVRLQLAVSIGNQAALAARDRARLEVERLSRELYAAEIDVAAEVREAVRQMRTLSESIRAGEESVRLAETNLDTERVKLRVGTSTAFEVQRRNQELQEARSRLLRNLLDFKIAEAELLHVQGLLYAPGERPLPAVDRK